MITFLIWYLFISLLGLITFPLAYRMLPALADRGYAFSRSLGLLLWGYGFWLLGSLGLIGNDIGGHLLALILLVVLCAWVLRGGVWVEVKEWLRNQRRLVITIEILFLCAFASWILVRAANPEIFGTEKPMELAFINAILRSPKLPPHDPWLSGYGISYYYFGYVMVAMLARITGTTAGIAFNLGLSLVFGLSAIGAYGILFNLLSTVKKQTGAHVKFQTRNLSAALLGPFFVLIVSNFEGFFHMLHNRGIFWRTGEDGELFSRFWAWMDLRKLSLPPEQPFSWVPTRHWWWWDASRVVQDYDFLGVNKGDVIDEFPFFSYLLGDLHPHVLTMPFAFLAIALTLNLFLGEKRSQMRWFGLRFAISPQEFALGAVVLGAMAFLNTWDFPIYVALYVGAYILKKMGDILAQSRLEDGYLGSSDYREMAKTLVKDFFGFGLALGVTGGLLYLPFYAGFSSQAGGPLPNLLYVTRGVHLWVMFGVFLIPLFAFLIYLWKSGVEVAPFSKALSLVLGFILALLILSLLLVLVIVVLPLLQSINPEAADAPGLFLGSMAAPGWGEVILQGLVRRLTIPGALLTLILLLTLVVGLLWPRRSKDQTVKTLGAGERFVLLLVLFGALLVLAPEFVFLRDMFGYRINTIFKFYFQAWLLWGVGAAYFTVKLFRDLSPPWGTVFRWVMVMAIAAALVYPVFGLWSKTNGFNPSQWTIDGTAYRKLSSPDEAALAEWLRSAPLGVVAEAVGGSYSSYARVASHSGQPTVLGWDFHEMQWRGGTEEMGSRKADIERLYCTHSWTEAEKIIRQYDIQYVVVGNLERTAYPANETSCPAGVNEGKFLRYLDIVFQEGAVTLYEVPEGDVSP
jgi:YYY domain-containing protein